jgi:hypothetical protein
MMNEQQPIPIHQLIQKLIAQSPHQHKMMEASIICAWHSHMPAIVRKRTKRIYVKQNKIFVEITASSLRHELNNAKQTILEKLQAHVSDYTTNDIKDIVFIV